MKPFTHQLVSIKHNDTQPRVFDTSDAGTGKTFVRIATFAKRRAKGGGCLLVVCPRSTMRTVWATDFKKFAPHLVVVVADAANREEAFAAKADVYIVNHDGVKWLAKQKKPAFAKFSEIAIDESSAFKHHASDRSASLRKIINHFEYRACMTATPNSNSITDVWHQALLLDGGARLGKLFYQFRSSVTTPVQTGSKASHVSWIDREGAEEAVFGLLSDIVIRHKLDDCADIPENYHHSLSYQMSTAQKKAYMEMETTQLLDLGKKGGITAINAAAVITKLLQVASGAVYHAKGEYHVIDKSRYDLVLDLAEQRKYPLVLFLWNHQKDLLVEGAKRRGLKFAVFDGDTSDKDRAVIVQRYQAGHYDVLFAHPKTVGHGQTLTRGTSTIWASPTYDAELAVQASSRQRRIGQTKKTETLVVLAEGTRDEDVFEIMTGKKGRMNNLLDLFSTVVAPAKKAARRKTKEVA